MDRLNIDRMGILVKSTDSRMDSNFHSRRTAPSTAGWTQTRSLRMLKNEKKRYMYTA